MKGPIPRWGHPLPPPSRYLSPRALIWMTVLLVVGILGTIIVYFVIEKQLEGTERVELPGNVDLPMASEYMPVANYLAKREQADAELISILFERNAEASERILYSVELLYCSPAKPNWFLQVHWQYNPWEPGRKHATAKHISGMDHLERPCAESGMQIPVIHSAEAIVLAQNYMQSNFSDMVHLWPTSLEVKRDQTRRMVWEIVFHAASNGQADPILFLDAVTGEILSLTE